MQRWRMHWVSGLLVAVALQTAPAAPDAPKAAQQVASVPLTAAPAFNTNVCQKKRVDPCGCHHVYGLRHCHPNRMSSHCERLSQAPVAPAPQRAASRSSFPEVLHAAASDGL